jgi:hypothetical protein
MNGVFAFDYHAEYLVVGLLIMAGNFKLFSIFVGERVNLIIFLMSIILFIFCLLSKWNDDDSK